MVRCFASSICIYIHNHECHIHIESESAATAQIGGEPDDQHNDPIDVTAQNEHAVQYTEEPRQSGHRSAEPIDFAAYKDMPYEEQAYSEYEAVEYEHEGAGASGYQAATPIVQNQYRNWSESAAPAAAGEIYFIFFVRYL